MATLAKIDTVAIQVDSEGDPKTVTIWATSKTYPQVFYVASDNFDTPLDAPAAIATLVNDLDIDVS